MRRDRIWDHSGHVCVSRLDHTAALSGHRVSNRLAYELDLPEQIRQTNPWRKISCVVCSSIPIELALKVSPRKYMLPEATRLSAQVKSVGATKALDIN